MKINKGIVISIITTFIVAGILSSMIFKNMHDNATTYKYPYKEDALMKMTSAKESLIHVVDSIILSSAPNSSLSGFELVTKSLEYNVDIIFILAQGKLESNFGTDGVAIKTNGVWNVGAYDNLSHAKMFKIYKYAHPNQSIEPYLSLLNRRYLVNGKIELQLMEKYVDIDGNRYASDPDYEHKLTEIYHRYKTETSIYDKMLRYNKLKLLYESY